MLVGVRLFTNAPKSKGAEVAAMLKAIHAQEDRQACLQRAQLVVQKLTAMKLMAAARVVQEGIAETLTVAALGWWATSQTGARR